MAEMRGILFTFSALLLGGLLLSLATMLSQQSALGKESAVRLLELDGASDAFVNTQSQLAYIIGENAQFGLDNATLEMNQTLPWRANTLADLGRFANFTMGHSDYNSSVDLSGFGNGNFFIRPGNSLISENPGEFAITPENSENGSGGITAYEVDVEYPPGAYASTQWSYTSVSASPPDTMDVRVHVHDSSYAANDDKSFTILKSDANTMNIMDADNNLVGSVNFSPNASLRVGYNGTITLKTSINFTHQVYVEANITVAVNGSMNRTALARVG
jgi:hypothetical protein